MLNTDATLNAEGSEECGEYAHDELEYRLESFFVLFQTVKYQFVSFLLKIKSTSQPKHNKMRIN